MARMVRKTIYITEDQARFLTQRAGKLDMSESEVVRQALDDAEDRAKTQVRRDALDRHFANIQKHQASAGPQTGTGWKFDREEIYEEMYQERFERSRRRREEAQARADGTAIN